MLINNEINSRLCLLQISFRPIVPFAKKCVINNYAEQNKYNSFNLEIKALPQGFYSYRNEVCNSYLIKITF